MLVPQTWGENWVLEIGWAMCPLLVPVSSANNPPSDLHHFKVLLALRRPRLSAGEPKNEELSSEGMTWGVNNMGRAQLRVKFIHFWPMYSLHYQSWASGGQRTIEHARG